MNTVYKDMFAEEDKYLVWLDDELVGNWIVQTPDGSYYECTGMYPADGWVGPYEDTILTDSKAITDPRVKRAIIQHMMNDIGEDE